MYKAKLQFRDLQDGHLYQAGDVFPHDGRDIPVDRIKALETGANASGKPLIVVVEESGKTAEKPKRRARTK